MIIYRIVNLVNNKSYVGQTVRSLELRWKQHVRDSKKSRYPIQKAIYKYGPENFLKEILCECKTHEELNEQEKHFCNLLNAWCPYGYNLKAGKGRGSVSDETRKKQSEQRKGEKNANFGNHVLVGENNPMYGKQHTKETLEKLSLAAKGKYVGEKNPMFDVHRFGKDAPMFGKQHSDNTKNKIGQRLSKDWYFISPDGQNIVITNLKKFCRDSSDSLSDVCMRKVHSGKSQSYKGWTKDIAKYEESLRG